MVADKQQKFLFLTVLESGEGLRSPRSRWRQIWYLARPVFWFIDGCLLAGSSNGEMDGRVLWGLIFIRALIPFMKALLSWPHHLLKSPAPSPFMLGIRLQHMNFGLTHSVYSTCHGGVGRGLTAAKLSVQIPAHHVVTVWPLVNHLISLWLNMFLYTLGKNK